MLLAIILSTIGFETNKFNNLISKKINLLDNNVDLQLISVKFKLDIKEISLFLETTNPQINYRNNYWKSFLILSEGLGINWLE